MGLVRPCGCGPGEFGLCRALVICRFSYLQVIGLGLREEVHEDLKFQRRRRGVGRGCFVLHFWLLSCSGVRHSVRGLAMGPDVNG